MSQPTSMNKAPTAGAAPLLSVRDLRVSFGGKAVVHGASFDLHAGEKLALVGESGSGKTVTALSLLRLAGDAHITGQALLDGRDLLTLPERQMQAVRGGAAPSAAMIDALVAASERLLGELKGGRPDA